MSPNASQCHLCKPSYIRSPEHKKLMSDRTRGTSPRGFGWKHSATTRKKIKKSWTVEKKELARQRGLKSSLDPEWRLRCGSPAEQNPAWNNGASRLPYARDWQRR